MCKKDKIKCYRFFFLSKTCRFLDNISLPDSQTAKTLIYSPKTSYSAWVDHFYDKLKIKKFYRNNFHLEIDGKFHN